MKIIAFGPDRIRVAPPTEDAWRAMAAVFDAHDYDIRTTDTDSYNCRTITGGTKKSLHSYGIALDINWKTNPYKDHDGVRTVQFSSKAGQEERAIDVKRHLADTDMTPAMIADIRAIKNQAGQTVFQWGGDWKSVKDAMHFQIDLSPDDLALGVDLATLRQPGGTIAPPPLQPETPSAMKRYIVAARNGLRMRAGPGTVFDIIRVIAFGTPVSVLSLNGAWALVDLMNDGMLDGYMHADFLKAA